MVTALLNAILVSSYQVDKRHIKRPTPWWLVIPVGRWSRRMPRIGHPLLDILLLQKFFFTYLRFSFEWSVCSLNCIIYFIQSLIKKGIIEFKKYFQRTE